MLKKQKMIIATNSNEKSKSNSVNDLPTIDEVLNLKLSPETQVYVQCRIGDQILGENNWIFVLKTDILTSIKETRDFLIAIDIVKNYPEDKLLIGSYGFDQSISEDFMLCTTVASKNRILSMVEDKKKKIAQIFDMPIYVWTSLGSEIEVDSMQNFNLRKLLAIQIDSVFPIFIGKRIFSIRDANDTVYIELFASRHEYKNIWRRRIDVACQVCAKQKNAYVQTRTSTNLCHSTQYDQQLRVQTPNIEICKRITQFLDSHLYDVEDSLQINYHIHLHKIDYAEFPNPYIKHVYTNYKEIVACQDIKKCRGKQVSCVSWSPFISGLFAASYVSKRFDHVHTSQPIFEDTVTFSEHVALVWSFSNMQKPILYLYSMREVTKISFCPYDENIIVGGCSNGQIIIWDIKGQLSKAETKEVLSPSEQENQNRIANLTLWMKKLPSVGHVNACVTSALQYGHKTAITNISWIPPDYYISNTGLYTKSPDDNSHMQFVTSSLEDGNICVWDLKHNQFVKDQKRSKPLQRLSQLPPALHKDVSPLKKKHNVFIPIFVLLLKDPTTHKPVYIRGMLFNNYQYHYEQINSIQLENSFERKYFTLLPVEIQFDWEQQFVVNTVSGTLYDCTWEGFPYDHGNKVNFDSCILKSYVCIHDAPIKMCIVNKDEPNIYLSIGGKVFAVWHRREPTPILWRKCASTFIFGKWSYVHPFEILLFTNDGFMQLWNFFLNSKSPIYIVRSHGMPPKAIYSNAGVEHYIRNALLLLDRFGAIRIHTAGSRLAAKSVCSFQTHESIETFIETKRQVQNCVAFWCSHFKKEQHPLEEIPKEIIEAPVTTKNIVDIKKGELSKKQEFERNQHEYMYQKLTVYKGIEIKQLEENRKILEELIIHKNELNRKCAEALSNKAEFYERKKRLVAWEPLKVERKIFRISISMERAKNMKKQYFEDYLLLEKQLSNNFPKYKFVFDGRRIEQCRYRNLKILRYERIKNEESVIPLQFNYNIKNSMVLKEFNVNDD